MCCLSTYFKIIKLNRDIRFNNYKLENKCNFWIVIISHNEIIVLYKNVQRYLENVINYTDVLILILFFISVKALQNYLFSNSYL